MVILAIGLLGLVGLQGRLHVTQVESYQRAQALILLQDMSNRIALNRNDAAALRDGSIRSAPAWPAAAPSRTRPASSATCANGASS